MTGTGPPFESIVQRTPIGVFVASDDGELAYANDRLAELLEVEAPSELVTGSEPLVYADPNDEEAIADRLDGQGHVEAFETALVTDQGDPVEVRLTASIDDGNVYGYVREVTERKELERKTAEQAKAIREVEIPVVQVWDGVTLATVVGTLDTKRAQRLTEELLTALMDDRSAVAILDITGVGTIDTATAQHLIETVNAVTLLGSEVIITGINPDIAQTMVNLNITMEEIRTKASLADGLKQALRLLDDVSVETDSG